MRYVKETRTKYWHPFSYNEKIVFLEPWRELHCYVLINQGILKNATLVDWLSENYLFW